MRLNHNYFIVKDGKKKIFFFIIPFEDHVCPTVGIVEELIRRHFNVIYYGTDDISDIIENTGVEFRKYPYFPAFVNDPNTTKDAYLGLVEYFIDIANELLPFIINLFEAEKPDLIVYDVAAYHIKCALIKMKNNYIKDPTKHHRPPPAIIFSPTFCTRSNIYPSQDEILKLFDTNINKQYSDLYNKIINDQIKFNKKYKMNIDDPIKLFTSYTEDIKIVSVLSELQPKVELFDDSFKFVGCCISNSQHNLITNSKLSFFLKSVKIRDPLEDYQEQSEAAFIKLIYVYMGKLSEDKFYIYDNIITAFKTLHEENQRNVGCYSLRIIISTGPAIYRVFMYKIKNQEYHLPNNIILLETAPHKEILKKSSIFISHCGSNSIHESIHFGVPMICLPIERDQPLCALRIADELKLGIRLDLRSISVTQIRKCLHEILQNSVYRENMIMFSKISRSYDSFKISCDIIQNYIKEYSTNNS